MTDEELRKVREDIGNIYIHEDVSLSDILSTTQVPNGMTFEEAYRTYVQMMRRIEHDEFFRCNFDEEWVEYVYDGEYSTEDTITETDRTDLVKLLIGNYYTQNEVDE